MIPVFLSLRDIEKQYDEEPVLRGVSVDIMSGEIVALLGPSGCGKTTLLRIIAGLEEADRGAIHVEGLDITDTPVHRRRFGMVFQDYALFPHKNVAENVAFGLRMMNLAKQDINVKVAEALNLVGLRDFESRAVFDLSGGEQQRVALARSLAPSPRLLLLDEPLGSLDRALRERLMGELRTILKRLTRSQRDLPLPQDDQPHDSTIINSRNTFTSLYVTHDQEEAFAIADRVAVMHEGRIVQVGSPTDLYRQPITSFVARFLGMENILPVTIISSNPPLVHSDLGELEVRSTGRFQGNASLLIRPDAAKLVTNGEPTGNTISGELRQISFRGRFQVVTFAFETDGATRVLKFELDSSLSLPSTGKLVRVSLNPNSLLLLE